MFEARTKKRLQRESRKPANQDEEDEFKFHPLPLVITDDSPGTPELEPQPHQNPETCEPNQSSSTHTVLNSKNLVTTYQKHRNHGECFKLLVMSPLLPDLVQELSHDCVN